MTRLKSDTDKGPEMGLPPRDILFTRTELLYYAGLMPNFWAEIFPLVAGLRPASLAEIPLDMLSVHTSFIKSVPGLLHDIMTVEELNSKRILSRHDMQDNSPRDAALVFISWSEEILRKLVSCELENDQFGTGMFLGYPECCVKAFVSKNTSACPIPREDRYYSHIPCSPECLATAEYERRVKEEVRRYMGQKFNSRW